MGLLSKIAMAFGFRRGDLPEPPPDDFRSLPPGPGYKIQYFDSLSDLDRWARENNIGANDAYNPRRFMGGVAVKSKIIGLPRPGLLRDTLLDEALYQHEVGGHSNDLVHAPGGHGWGWQGPDGKFYPISSAEELSAAKAKYAAPLTFNWSGVFSGKDGAGK